MVVVRPWINQIELPHNTLQLQNYARVFPPFIIVGFVMTFKSYIFTPSRVL